MGFLRKTVKKIGKAIKKVGKAFGKLGIVGQIGMMFLMPHLGTMWGNLGSWAAKGSNILQKAVGVIHKAGTAVGNAYQTVTQAISNGFDRSLNFMKGEGFVLSDPSKGFFGADVKLAKGEGIVEPKGVKISDDSAVFDTTIKDEVKEKVTQPSILDKVKDEVIDSGIKGVGDFTRKKIAGQDEIDYRNTYVDVGGMSPISSSRGVFDTTDLTQQSFQPNNWQEISQFYSVPVNQRLG